MPTIDIPELSALENVTLPDTLINALTDLNSSIPTLDEFRSGLDSLISTPIEALRAQINRTLSNSSIDVELLPVPARQKVELCHDLDTSWVDDVGDGLGKFVKVAIGLVVLAMVLFIAANALWERYRYRAFLGGVLAAREAWLLDLVGAAGAADPKAATAATAHETLSTTNLLSFLNASAHPSLFRFVARLSALLRLETSSGKANLIWFLSYVAHPYAWAFLALGVVGLVVVQVQIAILDGPVRRMTKERATAGAGEFSSSVTGTLNARMEAAGAEWAESTNRAILGVEDGINTNLVRSLSLSLHVLGARSMIVTLMLDSLAVRLGQRDDDDAQLDHGRLLHRDHGAPLSLRHPLSRYSTLTLYIAFAESQDAITDVFNGTVLEDPALGLVYVRLSLPRYAIRLDARCSCSISLAVSRRQQGRRRVDRPHLAPHPRPPLPPDRLVLAPHALAKPDRRAHGVAHQPRVGRFGAVHRRQDDPDVPPLARAAAHGLPRRDRDLGPRPRHGPRRRVVARAGRASVAPLARRARVGRVRRRRRG